MSRAVALAILLLAAHCTGAIRCAGADELTRRAAAAREKGQVAEAEALARQSIAALRTGDRTELAEALAELGLILSVKGDGVRAQAALAKAEAIARQVRGDRDLVVAGIQNKRAAVATLRGDAAGATASLRKVLATREALLPAGHLDIGSTLFELAESLTQQGLHEEAAPFYKRALDLAAKSFPATHPARVLIQRRTALNATQRGKTSEATALLAPVVRAPPGESRLERAQWSDTALTYAEALEQQGSWAEAASTYKELLAVQEKALGADSELLTDTLTAYARCLRKTGAGETATLVEQRLERLEGKP